MLPGFESTENIIFFCVIFFSSEEIRNHLMENCDEYKIECVTTMYFYDYAPWGMETFFFFFFGSCSAWNET